MGALVYGATGVRIEVPDSVLTHLEALAVQKLRRSEGFALRWVDETGCDGSVWVHAGTDLQFRYSGARTPNFDRSMLEQMVRASSSNAGLDLSRLAQASTGSEVQPQL